MASPETQPPPERHWKEIAKEAQDHRDSTMSGIDPPLPRVPANLPKNVMSIPRQILDKTSFEITSLPPEELLHALHTGRLTAVSVTRAYLQHAALSQTLVNCLTELLPSRALSRAQELDAYYAQHRQPIGPLHGLPISVKEHINFAGLRTTTGYISQWSNIAQADAHILQILASAGAVFHCRTTIPQTMMHLETDSNLYGTTVNPYNRDLTPGGSSGGEAALIALHGSPLGIGSDVGGSIRCPAANCGIYGFKPTAFRIPTEGWGYGMASADHVESVLGPLSTSLAGIKLFMKTLIDAQPWLVEPALIPLPWRTHSLPAPGDLRIGILAHDGVVAPHPPIQRALATLKSRLEAAGIRTVPFAPYRHDHAWRILSALYFPDGGATESAAIAASGEPWLPLFKFIIQENPHVKALSVSELSALLEAREVYRKEYAARWADAGIDVLVCPTGPGVAGRHGGARYWGYTSLWNLLDYPGLSFPVGVVDKGVDGVRDGVEEMSAMDGVNKGLFDAEEMDGLPICLQMVGRRFEDEKVLGIFEYIQERLGLPFEAAYRE